VKKKVCWEIFAQSSNDHIWCGLVVDWYQPPHPARSKYVFNLSKNKIWNDGPMMVLKSDCLGHNRAEVRSSAREVNEGNRSTSYAHNWRWWIKKWKQTNRQLNWTYDFTHCVQNLEPTGRPFLPVSDTEQSVNIEDLLLVSFETIVRTAPKDLTATWNRH